MSKIVSKKLKEFFCSYSFSKYPVGSILIQPGSKEREIYYIESGEVAQCRTGTSKERVVVNVFKAGSYIPIYRLFDGSAKLYYFVANKPTIAYCAPAGAVLRFIKEDNIIMLDTIKRLSVGLGGLVDKLFISYTGSAKQRVVLELCIIHSRRNKDTGNQEITITHNELAEKCGLTRETVSRVLSGLARGGYIYKKNNKIGLINIATLQKLIS